jgi:hypothetical protein
LCEKLESVLLFSDVDGLPEEPETSPKLFRNVMLQLRLEQVTEHVLQLVEHGLLVHRLHLDVQDLKKQKICIERFKDFKNNDLHL